MSKNNKPKNINHQNIHQKKETEHVLIRTSYEGALPLPSDLAKFNEIIPNGADRIMIMAEKNQEAQIALTDKQITLLDQVSKREHFGILAGQIFAFILCFTALLAGVFAIVSDKEWFGAILSIIGVSGVIRELIRRGK